MPLTKLEGRADMGVSIVEEGGWVVLVLFEPEVPFMPGLEDGGGGRAKGLGGPWAPALRMELLLGFAVEGDGAGKTTPEEWFVSELFLPPGVLLGLRLLEPWGDGSAEPPSDEPPLGI